jgi:nucleoside-diphosphate-sugar epimerase
MFITGATGYIGRAVTRALIRAGHQVTALARAPEAEKRIRALGAVPLRGNLADPRSYRGPAGDHDAIVHIAFDRSGSESLDRTATQALLDAAREGGKTKTFIYTSGVLVLGDTGGRPADENFPTEAPAPVVSWRPALEKLVTAPATKSLATAVLRPGFVWGGKGGNFSLWFEQSRQDGAASFVGPGGNRRAYVHREDLARLYLLIIERRAQGIFHGVDGAAVKISEAAAACSRQAGAGGKTKSQTVEEARKTLGLFADGQVLDQVVITRRSPELGWKPARPAFPESIGTAFQEWSN